MKYIIGKDRLLENWRTIPKQWEAMVRRTKTILGHNKFTSLYDKGYHTGSEFDYAHRQAIVEHPYGIIKRQWGFNYIMTKKTIKRASADVGFIFISYNLRRLLNIVPDIKDIC